MGAVLTFIAVGSSTLTFDYRSFYQPFIFSQCTQFYMFYTYNSQLFKNLCSVPRSRFYVTTRSHQSPEALVNELH